MSIKTEIRKYKCMVVVRPTLSSDKVLELVNGMLAADMQKDESVESQHSTMQVLSYAMDRNKQGHMVTMDLKIRPKTLLLIRRRMELDENILRVMFVKDAFQLKDDFVKSMSIHTTKRGKISFNKTLKRRDKCFVSQSIKRLRFMGLLPYCNYDY
jgi:ribosomal protein S6